MKGIEIDYYVGCKTKFHCATDSHGSRVSAVHLETKQRIVRSWDHALNDEDNYIRIAAEMLGCNRLVKISVNPGEYIFACDRFARKR